VSSDAVFGEDAYAGQEWLKALTPRGRALLDFLDACELGGCDDEEIDAAAERWLVRHKDVEFL
jgi:hypothetical protein